MFNILVNCALFNSWFFSCTFLFSCYNYILFGGIAQLVRAHGSHPWGRGFKSPCLYQKRNDNLQRKIVVPLYYEHYSFLIFSISLFTESHCDRIYTLYNYCIEKYYDFDNLYLLINKHKSIIAGKIIADKIPIWRLLLKFPDTKPAIVGPP